MQSLIDAHQVLLGQAADLLDSMDATAYTQSCSACFGSSVGGHFRHVLEHYQALCNGVPTGCVDYEARQRGSAIESSLSAARAMVADLTARILSLSAQPNCDLEIHLDDGGEAAPCASNFHRELQFVLSHTVHHFALIHTILRSAGFTRLPADFGVAPSTLRFRKQQAQTKL